MKARGLITLAALLAALAGCDKIKALGGGGEASPTSAAAQPGPAAAGEIGVPECDTFLTQYRCFLRKMQPDGADTQVDQMRDAWKQAASMEATRASIREVCVKQLEIQRDNFAGAGCGPGGGGAPASTPAVVRIGPGNQPPGGGGVPAPKPVAPKAPVNPEQARVEELKRQDAILAKKCKAGDSGACISYCGTPRCD